MRIDRENISRFFNAGLLLVPGFLYAVLSLLLSSNSLLPAHATTTLFLLNFAQLLSFGVTIAKYAADQMLLARLKPGEHALLGRFFTRRVLPLSLIFCALLLITHTWETTCALLACVLAEVFVITVIFELNISRRYIPALVLNLAGYPFVFICYIAASFTGTVSETQLMILFVVTGAAKSLLALKLRNKGKPAVDVLVRSAYVPVQQAGNYLLFKSDQLIIAGNLIPSAFFNFSLPGDYLFYAKFTEVFSGVATSMGPFIAGTIGKEPFSRSFRKLVTGKYFLGTLLAALIAQAVISLLLLKSVDELHLMLLIPYLLVTVLIVPVNRINYEFYRANYLRQSSMISLVSLGISVFLLLVNVYFKSVVLFAWAVPLQLTVFMLLGYYFNAREKI